MSWTCCSERRQRMKSRELIIPRFQIGLILALVTVAAYLASYTLLAGEDAKPVKAAAPSKKAEKKPQKRLSGAELYAINCNRCHPERYATERTEAQWKTAFVSTGAGLSVVGIALLFLFAVTRTSR